jgi:arylsulfatase A-like enzyme
VLIVADGLGYGDLGCYGQPKILTPRINALAASGLRLTCSYAGAGTDAAARSALLTGVTRQEGSITGLETLAERLSSQGYNTGLIGYWGLGGFDTANAPQQRGFEVVITYGDRRHSHDLYTDHLYRKDPLTGYENSIALAGNPSGRRGSYLPDLLTQAAVKFCRQNKPERLNEHRPFFLLLSYPVPAAAVPSNGPFPDYPAYADKDWSVAQKARANAITRFDEHVGQIVDELAERGMAQNTVVLVTSSLGPEASSPAAAWFHSAGPFVARTQPLSEGRLRIPLVVAWPFWMDSATTSDALIRGEDLVPTLLDSARVEIPEDLGGRSFLPLLTGEPHTNTHPHLSWSLEDDTGTTHLAVRRDHWKAVQNGRDTPWRLYDLTADPAEETDLADRHPAVVRGLRALPRHSERAGEGSLRPGSDG